MKLCAIQVSRLNYVNNYRSLESLCPGILLCWSSMVLVTRVVIEKMLNTNKALGLSRISTDTSLLMDKLIRPVFTLEVNHKIVPGLVTVGKYDGSHPCITAATTADKVLIHSPHRKTSNAAGRLVWSETNREIATLNINQTITAIVAGHFLPNDEKDILIVGSPTHILVYHVHDNKDILYKECPDGVKAIALGHFRDFKQPLVIVGGNSSVHAYDHEGNELFWTVIGDVVTSLCLLDYNRDGLNELLVSSEDFNVRVFKGDKIICELTETEVVTGLVALPENRFSYSVSNGTIGVYDQDVRLWRVKSKNFAISIYIYDLLGQGSPQLITGWSNGKIDCRSIKTGEVLFKDALHHGTAGIVEADYRSIGKTDLICVSEEGEVRGYTTTRNIANASGVNGTLEQDTVRDLLAQKQTLLMELRHYDENTKFNEDTSKYEQNLDINLDVIPANTRLQISINPNGEKNKNYVEVTISTNNDTIIKAIIVFAEGIFKGETHVVHPPVSKLKSELSVPLYPPKDSPVDIHIKALVGYSGGTQYHVFEVTRQLPRFAMYTLMDEDLLGNANNESLDTQSHVEFKITERLQRICIWINQNFLLDHDLEFESGARLGLRLKCLRDHSELLMQFESNGRALLYTENMLLAADLLQSLAVFLNLESLESKASFPKQEEELRVLLERLNDIQEARLRLGTDVADRLGLIRAYIVRAEDARMNSIKDMPKYYNELNKLNEELINGYKIRLANYQEGLETMKKINSILQKASRLRVGQKSADMIAHCRIALKNSNTEALIKIIRVGQL